MNLIVTPPDVSAFWGWSPPPLSSLYLAAMDTDTRIWDGTVDGDPVPYIQREKPRVVGVAVYTSARHDALRILRAAHDCGCVTVAGGPHVTAPTIAAQWEREYPFVDFIVRGDGETAWRLITHGFHSASKIVYRPTVKLDSISDLPWERMGDLSRYSARDHGVHNGVDLSATPRISIVSSRGCVGRCRYCAAWRNIGYRQHTAAWMRRNYFVPLASRGIKHLCFDDDCFGADESLTTAMLEDLDRFGFVWQATTRSDILTPDLCNRMAAAGCWRVCIGVESGSRTMLAIMGKTNNLRQVLAARRAVGEAGMEFSALMMEGYPGETDLTRAEDAAFRAALAPDNIGTIGCTLILPGTDLWYEQVRAGKVTDDYWLGQERHLVAR